MEHNSLDTIMDPKLGAYFGDKTTKSVALRDMNAHKRADAFLRGHFSKLKKKAGKVIFQGCSVGCSIASAELRAAANKKGSPLTPTEVKSFYQKFNGEIEPHMRMACYYNISPDLAQLNDYIFETLPLRDAKEWPVEFLRAIKPGSDLSGVVKELCEWIRENHSVWWAGRVPSWDDEDSAYNIGRMIYRWDPASWLEPEQRREKNKRVRIVRDQLLAIMKKRQPAKSPKSRKRSNKS